MGVSDTYELNEDPDTVLDLMSGAPVDCCITTRESIVVFCCNCLGTSFLCQVLILPVKNENDEVVMLLLAFEDLSTFHQTEPVRKCKSCLISFQYSSADNVLGILSKSVSGITSEIVKWWNIANEHDLALDVIPVFAFRRYSRSPSLIHLSSLLGAQITSKE